MSLRALYDLPAPAKLNLFLHVTGRRDDGYHLLQSVFVPIDWHDRLHLERREDGQLERIDLTSALPAEDLCLRAARALQTASGCRLGATISIEKHLPSGAGLGGGSSDAATVLIGLNRLWGLRWPRERLAELALPLGADVPFFVHGRPAWVEGIGERITPIELLPMDLAVLKPPASLPTVAIFRDEGLVRDTPVAILMGFPEQTRLKHVPGGVDAAPVTLDQVARGWGRNDLQAVAERIEPQVVLALQRLALVFGNGRMTGSGSAVFARVMAPSPAGAAEVLAPQAAFRNLLQALAPEGWSGWMGRSLTAHPLRDWDEPSGTD